MTGTAIHNVWKNMLQRCNNPNHTGYKDYGGRGISICDRWRSFENFYADMGNPPAGRSIDRIDVNGNYEPSNCKWSTSAQQNRNRRDTIYVDGFDLRLIAEVVGIPYSTLYGRLWRARRRRLSRGQTR